jgi:hypothetical protein
MWVLKKVVNPVRVECGCSANKPVDFITLLKQEFG